jgi:hypothetical protein
VLDYPDAAQMLFFELHLYLANHASHRLGSETVSASAAVLTLERSLSVAITVSISIAIIKPTA